MIRSRQQTARRRLQVWRTGQFDPERALGYCRFALGMLALHEEGRKTARDWLERNFNKIGESSSMDVDAKVTLRLNGSHSAVADLRPQ